MASSSQSVAKITGQSLGFDITGRGTAEEGWWVYFTTAKGAPGKVFLRKADYTPDAVFAAVRDQAAKLDAVHAADVPPG